MGFRKRGDADMIKVFEEDGLVIWELKKLLGYTIDKVKEKNGDIFYDVYDSRDYLVDSFKSLKEAKKCILERG